VYNASLQLLPRFSPDLQDYNVLFNQSSVFSEKLIMMNNSQSKVTCSQPGFFSISSVCITPVLIGLLLAGCGGSGGGTPASVIPPEATVVVSGTIDLDGVVTDGISVTSMLVVTAATDGVQSTTTSDANGDYTLTILSDTDTYFEIAKADLATINTQFMQFPQDTAGLNYGMILVTDVEALIDAAFGGMALDLSDKAWLAINIVDANGDEIDGVTITSVPGVVGGGALNCDGSLTGANITAAQPPCNPERGGPMFLAYFDSDAEITVTVTGGAGDVVAPVRLGEATFFEIEQ